MQFQLQVLRGQEGVSGLTLEAHSESDARAQASRQGYTVLSVRAPRHLVPAWFTRGARFPVLMFSQELLALLNAGLSVVEALETLAAKESHAATRDLLRQIVRRLHEGQPFSMALEAFPQAFPPLYAATLRAAEQTSDLAAALTRYIHYQSQLDTVRRKMVSASIYPVLLLVVGGAVIAFLMSYVVPRFSGIYESTRGQLPWMSAVLLQWGKLLAAYRLEISGVVLAAIAALAYGLTQPLTREWFTRRLWSIPAVGRRMHLFQLARLYRTLGMLLTGGVPMVAAAGMAHGLMPLALREALTGAIGSIRSGRAISEALELNGLTTEVAARMLRVGERTGNMGEMMDRIASFYEEDMARWVDWFTRLFEPLLMTLIGLIVGGIVVLMYVPIFELAGTLQ